MFLYSYEESKLLYADKMVARLMSSEIFKNIAELF